MDVINPNESDFSADEKSGEKVSGDSSDEEDAIQTEVEEAEEEVATSTDAPPVDRILQNMKRRYTWVKKDFDIEAGSFENNFPLPPAEPLSAVEYFDMFVSRSMLKAVVDESNKYYFQKHGATLNLTVKKLTSVLGMFFRMGLVNMHRIVEETSYRYQPLQAAALRLSARAAAGARVTSANSYNHREGDPVPEEEQGAVRDPEDILDPMAILTHGCPPSAMVCSKEISTSPGHPRSRTPNHR
ncbi:hypothetical protein MRX96_037173 [Rhipicephalus microplus]